MSFLVRARESLTFRGFVSDVISTLDLSAQSGIDCRRDTLADGDENTACARPARRRGVFPPRARDVGARIQKTRQSPPSVAVGGPEFVSACGMSYLGGLESLFLFVAVGLEEEIQVHYL
jgi:hypothetical protein